MTTQTRGVPTAQKPARKRATRVPLVGILPLVALLAIWQATGGSRPYLPPPSTWFEGLVTLAGHGRLLPSLLETLGSSAIALLASILIGGVVGSFIGRIRFLDRLLDPVLEFLRFTPSSAMVPIAVLLLGYEQSMKITVVVLGAVWPILLNARLGAKSIDGSVIDLARSLRMSRFDAARKIILPMMVPYLVIGTRVATPTVLILVLLVEVVTNVPGLGSLFGQAQATFQTNQIYGLVTITGVLGIAVSSAVIWGSSRLLRYLPD